MTNRGRCPPRVVIDTNVLLDFWLFDDPVARPLRAAFDDGRVVALRDDARDAGSPTCSRGHALRSTYSGA